MWLSVLSQGRSVPLLAPSISRTQRSPQARNRLRPLARLIPPGSPHRSMSASTTRPVRHNAPSQLSIVARPHWMASYVPGELIPCAFIWHDPGITPCCKSPKLPGDDFLAGRRSDRRTPVCIASITLPRSPVSLSVGDEVPHILTRRSRLKPGEFSITGAKRLLQHNRHIRDLRR